MVIGRRWGLSSKKQKNLALRKSSGFEDLTGATDGRGRRVQTLRLNSVHPAAEFPAIWDENPARKERRAAVWDWPDLRQRASTLQTSRRSGFVLRLVLRLVNALLRKENSAGGY